MGCVRLVVSQVALAVALALVAHPAQATGGTLTILTEVAPPFQIKLPSGEMGGNFVEAVREIPYRVRNKDPIKEVSWARGYQQLLTKPNTVLFGVARNAQRDPLFHWVGPFTEVVYGLYLKADSDIVLNRWSLVVQAMKKDGTFDRLMKKDNPSWMAPKAAITQFRE